MKMIFSTVYFKRMLLSYTNACTRSAPRATQGGCNQKGFLLATAFGLSGWVAASSDGSSTRSEHPVARRGNPHTLFVWDFDWTVVNCNSDEYIPAQFFEDDAELSAGFRKLLRSGMDWHACVEAMVGQAMAKGATPEKILEAARRMPYLTGVRRTLDDIHGFRGLEPGVSTGQMILSDGNTLFIGAFLEENGLFEHFSHGVISNEGMWDKECAGLGRTRLRVVHQSEKYSGHNCGRCSANLCKTQALWDTLVQWFREPNAKGDSDHHEIQRRPRIVYVGDGANDACPVLNVLGEGDVMLARAGRKRILANGREGPETDEEAIATNGASAVVCEDDTKRAVDEGVPFGILPALRRAREGDPSLAPKCKVLEWRTGDELRHHIGKLLEDIADD
uniref:Uncharacterized protein n=1 Tax=Odontella aurita TaxID=265563 RepID=A0A7S4JHM9_9STRA|mmetsp:Transcript_46655/g.141357  ORF Transcript_46655/g.141357 Transcript_46655/m.141357 type:complete len:391 (+) Transcript_46655:66-1238(+)